MEDDLNFWEMEDDLNFWEMEDDQNFSKMEDDLHLWKIEDDLIFWKMEDNPKQSKVKAMVCGTASSLPCFCNISASLEAKKS